MKGARWNPDLYAGLPREGQTCVIDGCEDPVNAHGLCMAHFKRWRRNGDPGGRVKKRKLSYEQAREMLRKAAVEYADADPMDDADYKAKDEWLEWVAQLVGSPKLRQRFTRKVFKIRHPDRIKAYRENWTQKQKEKDPDAWRRFRAEAQRRYRARKAAGIVRKRSKVNLGFQDARYDGSLAA